MRLLSWSRMSCWVNWNCRDYINGINELWLPDVSALIKTAWWAKWAQADKRTGSILWAYRLLTKETLLPLFSTGMSLGHSDYRRSSGGKAVSKPGCPPAVWVQAKHAFGGPGSTLTIHYFLWHFVRFTAYRIYDRSF